MDIRLVIKIEPEPQARPRATVIRSKFGVVKAHVYKDPKAASQENTFITHLFIDKNRPKKPIEGPVNIYFTAYIQKPKTSKNKYPIVKPDVDNYAKFLLDCLKEARYYVDDCQVVCLFSRKCYVDNENPEPKWVIKIVSQS
jgi:Holliday junction resolvase RusA-like endonuclease